MYPETVARLVARPMDWLSDRDAAVRLAAVAMHRGGAARCSASAAGPTRSVTEEEIAASLEEGVDAGVIEAQEHQMVRNVFRLDDRQIGSMMIPRAEIVWLDAGAPIEQMLERVIAQRPALALPGVPRRPGRRHRRDRARRRCCRRWRRA